MKQKVLFFINGSNPTAEQLAAAESIQGCAFRNTQAIRDDDKPERCTHVLGDAPESYKDVPVYGPAAGSDGTAAAQIQALTTQVAELTEALNAANEAAQAAAARGDELAAALAEAEAKLGEPEKTGTKGKK